MSAMFCIIDIDDGWFVATEYSDYIQAIGLSSANSNIWDWKECNRIR